MLIRDVFTHFVCLSSSITHESPVYLVNNGGVQPFLSLCEKKQFLCRLKMGNSSNLLWRLNFTVISTVHTALKIRCLQHRVHNQNK